MSDLDYETVAADLARRDALDRAAERQPAPEADDADVIDTTDRSIDEIVDEVLSRLPADVARDAEPAPVAPHGARRPHVARAAEPARRGISYAIVRGGSSAFAKVSDGCGCEGTEQVPTDGAFVLAPVHRSNVDFALVLAAHEAADALPGQGLHLEVRRRSAASCRRSAASPCTGASADRECAAGRAPRSSTPASRW